MAATQMQSDSVTMLRRFFQKFLVKILLLVWLVTSLTYILLSISSENTPRVDDRPKNPKMKPISTTRIELDDPWSCSGLQSQISMSVKTFPRFSQVQKGHTSYCLAMLESLQKCQMLLPDENPLLLPNPFIEYPTASEFQQHLQRYREAHIYFVHVMKSSGTSFEQILRKYGSSSVEPKVEPILTYYCSDMLNFYNKAQLNPSKRYIALDKRAYGLHRIVNQSGFYVTVLRDPVDRFISMYWYIKNGMYPAVLGDQLFQDVFDSKDLDDFLGKTKHKQIPFFDNHSIRMFQFQRYPEIFSTFSGGKDTYIPGHTQIPAVNQSHYEEARKNLEKQAFVGLTEKFPESQEMLSYLLGITIPTQVKSNVNSRYSKNSATPQQREAIEKRTAWDRQLYNDAKMIFDREYSNYQAIKST